MRSFRLPVVCIRNRRKKIPKVVCFFCKTWKRFVELGSRKEMIFFSSLFCLSRRERLFLFDSPFFRFHGWIFMKNPETFEKETKHFEIRGILFLFLLSIAHEYHILCCPLPNRITGSDFILKGKIRRKDLINFCFAFKRIATHTKIKRKYSRSIGHPVLDAIRHSVTCLCLSCPCTGTL